MSIIMPTFRSAPSHCVTHSNGKICNKRAKVISYEIDDEQHIVPPVCEKCKWGVLTVDELHQYIRSLPAGDYAFSFNSKKIRRLEKYCKAKLIM